MPMMLHQPNLGLPFLRKVSSFTPNSALSRTAYKAVGLCDVTQGTPHFPLPTTHLKYRPIAMRIAISVLLFASFALSYPTAELADGTSSGLERRQTGTFLGRVTLPLISQGIKL